MRITFFPKLELTSKPVLLHLALAAAIAAGCGGGSTSPPTPGTAGSSAGNSAGGTSGGNSGGGTTGSGGSTAGSGGSGGNVGSGGNSTAGSGGGTAGSTGGNVGAGGNSTGGAGGGTAGSAGGSGGTAGNGGGGTTGGAQAGRGGSTAGSGGSTAGAGGSGGGGAPTCPANNTFCSGFEATTLPAGAIYMVNAAPGDWSRDFAVDTSVRNSGNSSLRVKSGANETGTSGSAYKMLAVPATMNAFWVRLFIRSDMPIGMAEHNVFAGASIGGNPNDGIVEFAEDVGVSFNSSDDVRWPTGYGRLSGGGTMPYSLPASTWHCVEISFDGTGRVQQLFVGGNSLINATNYPATTRAFTHFKFGFNSLHGPARVLWYDDVAVAPTRIGGCN